MTLPSEPEIILKVFEEKSQKTHALYKKAPLYTSGNRRIAASIMQNAAEVYRTHRLTSPENILFLKRLLSQCRQSLCQSSLPFFWSPQLDNYTKNNLISLDESHHFREDSGEEFAVSAFLNDAMPVETQSSATYWSLKYRQGQVALTFYRDDTLSIYIDFSEKDLPDYYLHHIFIMDIREDEFSLLHALLNKYLLQQQLRDKIDPSSLINEDFTSLKNFS